MYPVPRICFRWCLAQGTVTMTRRQLPMRPAYASTYNGAQGETLARVVVDVRRPSFAHGHLYVALGRAEHRENIRILTAAHLCATDGVPLAKNVVCKELLMPETLNSDSKCSHQAAMKRPASRCLSPPASKRPNTESIQRHTQQDSSERCRPNPRFPRPWGPLPSHHPHEVAQCGSNGRPRHFR